MMNLPPWNNRLLGSTRGKIISLLRRTSRTVNELAEALGLTDNAVRAHLATLERDGLVRQGALRPSLRKPQYAYELTGEAEQLFPKAYDAVLSQLLEVLDTRFPPEVSEALLQEVGRRLAAHHAPAGEPCGMDERLEIVVAIFQDLGGLAEVEQERGRIVIRGHRCPLAGVSASYPQICRLAEALVAELLQAPVEEHCTHGTTPQCCLEVHLEH